MGLILSLKHLEMGNNRELVEGSIVTKEGDTLLFSNDGEVMENFLKLATPTTIGETLTNGDLRTIYKNTEIDCEFVYKEFTTKEELDTEGLTKVMTDINDTTVEGYMGVYGKTILIYHYSKGLGKEKLEKLNEELFSGNLEGLLHVFIK
ncbi:hypothetical protein COF68_05085 [Bacillus toyonensis]|uniref:hypothetical protein n=1 Tax=Bacillus toyonensis TaxID=155322 RepID=UPI000BFDD46A|nr:hypothetical protein [Bacillus toyonensis]PHE64221.1 hypothetical protein COF68_05085 [Bacillus toyonensis]